MASLPSWRNELPLDIPQTSAGLSSFSAARAEGKNTGLDIIEPAARTLSSTLSDDDRTLRERSGKAMLDKVIDRFPNILEPITDFRKFPEPIEIKIRQARMSRSAQGTGPAHPFLECGAFPDVGFAWAVVDSSFFLWQIDSSVPVPLEYSCESQIITAAGLLRPKPGVFVAAVEYVVILCTVVDVIMLSLCKVDVGAGSDADPSIQKWDLRPLPHYTAPTEALVLRSVACTAAGRAFLGADDGRIYELHYKASASWAWKRCHLRVVSGGMWSFLPSFLPNVLPFIRRPSAVVQLLVDEDRGLLYARSSDSKIRLFDLGFGCVSGPDFVAEVNGLRDAYEQNPRAEGGTLLKVEDEDRRKRKLNLLSLAVVPPYDLDRPSCHVVGTTADGTRCYFSSRFSDPPYGASDYRTTRPNALVLKVVQTPPQRPGSAFTTRSTGPLALLALQQSIVDFVDVTAAAYLGADALMTIRGPGASQVIITRCDPWSAYGTPSSGLFARDPANPMDKEPRMLEGETLALCPLNAGKPPAAPVLALMRQQMRTANRQVAPAATAVFNQLYGRPERFLVITSRGSVTLEKRRPVDVLKRLLGMLTDGDRTALERLRDLLDALGPAEAAALFLTVGTMNDRSAAGVIDQARTLFFDTGLWGDPLADEDANPRPTTQQRTDLQPGTASVAGLRPLNAGPLYTSQLGGLPAGATTAAGLGAARPLPALGGMAQTGVGTAGTYTTPTSTAPAASTTTAGLGTSSTAPLDMGRAIVESTEPVQTPQYRGVLLFMSRVLRPVWEETVLRLSNGTLSATISQEALLTVEDRLRAMTSFLRMATARRAALVLGTAGGMIDPSTPMILTPTPTSAGAAAGGGSLLFTGGSGAGGVPVAFSALQGMGGAGQITGNKRRRAEETIKQEESALSRLQALVQRACEALVLLRLTATHGGVTAVRPGGTSGELSYLDGSKFNDLVSTQEGESRLRRLAANLLASARAVGGERGAALSDTYGATLEDCCPSFFPREDRSEARAWSLLQRALENETDEVTKRKWAGDAVTLLSRHPKQEILPTAVQQLGRVGHWEGLVTLVVRFAEAASGGPLAQDTPEARGARDQSYRHILEALKALGDAKPAPAAPAVAAGTAPGVGSSAGNRSLGAALSRSAPAGPSSTAAAGAPSAAAPPRPSAFASFLHPHGATARPAAAAAAAPPNPWEFCGALDVDAKVLARRKILRAAGASNDPRLLEVLFRFLAQHVDLFPEIADPDLEMPGLETWLKTVGFAWPDPAADHRVPLEEAVRNLELLGRMYTRKGRYVAAAEVYERLAILPEAPPASSSAPVGLSVRPETLSLDQRLAYLETAVLQARASGDGALISRAEEALLLGTMQDKMLRRARELVGLASGNGSGGGSNGGTQGQGRNGAAAVPQEKVAAFQSLDAALSQNGLLPATELYQVAQRLQMWDLNLEIMKICRYSGAGAEEVARVLWDNFLKKSLEEAWNARGIDQLAPLRGGAAGSVPGALPVAPLSEEAGEVAKGTTAAQLRQLACSKVEALGARLYPNEACMVLTHIALRLESLVAGTWPEELRRAAGGKDLGADPDAAEAIACTLVSLCHNHWELPLRAYDVLLFHTPPLGLQRVQLLTTLRHLVRIACLKPEDIRARELALALANAAVRDVQRHVAPGEQRDALVGAFQDAANLLRYSLVA